MRSEGEFIEYRTDENDTVETSIEERAEEHDYSYYDALMRYLELRYNPYHDDKGRFCSGGGGGGGMLVVPKGQKGKGFYVGASDRDIAEQALATEYEEWKKVRQNVQGGQTAEETERIKSEIVDSINPKFAGIKRKAENGEGNWSWTKGQAASESEAQNMDHIWNVYDKGKYTVVDGSIGNKNVYFAADSSNPTVIKAKGIMAEREASRTERERKLARDSIETQGKSKTTTSTYDRWYSNSRKNFDAYWNGTQGNSRAEIDDDSEDPV